MVWSAVYIVVTLPIFQRMKLRSMSDKALGALRQAVADNEYLRDALRRSEDAKIP